MSINEMPYEIKFYLDANQVLSDEHELLADLVQLNQPEHQQLDIRFLDTATLDFHQSGWILRGRLKPNKDRWEITYKKRARLSPSETVEEAIEKMKGHGFDQNDPSLRMEVDWSGDGQTLNFSYEVKVDISELQNTADWQATFLKYAPEPLRRGQWNEFDLQALISKTILYGPIAVRKLKGEWSGLKVSVEVWKVADQSIVEITTEVAGSAAQSQRDLLQRSLQQQSLFPFQPVMSKTAWALYLLANNGHNANDLFVFLRQGGYNLYFRHAQPENMIDDDIGISIWGREQAVSLGKLLLSKQIPVQMPVLSSPIRRARETAEAAFGKEPEQVRIEERLIQPELDRLLELVPSKGMNQLFVAHYHHFNNQLGANEKIEYLDMVLLHPLGDGKGYRLVQVVNLLQESLVKYSKMTEKASAL